MKFEKLFSLFKKSKGTYDAFRSPVFKEAHPKQLTEKEFVDCVWYSFMFSQGSFPLQFMLLQTLHDLLGSQEHLDSDSLRTRIRERLVHTTKRGPVLKVERAALHEPVSSEMVAIETQDKTEDIIILDAVIDVLRTGVFTYKSFFTFTDGTEYANWNEHSFTRSISMLIVSIIQRDYEFLIKRKGRKGRNSQNDTSGQLSSKHFSFVHAYLDTASVIREPHFALVFERLRECMPQFEQFAKKHVPWDEAYKELRAVREYVRKQ